MGDAVLCVGALGKGGGGTGGTVAYRAHQADVSKDDDEHQVDLACHLGLHRPACRTVLIKVVTFCVLQVLFLGSWTRWPHEAPHPLKSFEHSCARTL